MSKTKERACWLSDYRRPRPPVMRMGRQRHRNGPVVTIKPADKPAKPNRQG